MIDISVTNLVKEFEVGSKILDGLTFQVDSGERVGLLGPNGCGKTTLLRILTGVMDYDEGEVVIAPGKRVGLISQIPVYPAGYTVEDVLDDAFADLHAMEREMTQLAETMGQGEGQAAMARYDKLTAAFQAGGSPGPGAHPRDNFSGPADPPASPRHGRTATPWPGPPAHN